ncbi:MAG TPA: glycosyltransferase family 2 protein [Candidatus Sulfotelmatobacter sp.]
MTAKPVCAVIVTYHPTAKMLENVSVVLPQVQGLVVVDNGSSSDELQPLRLKSQTLGFQLIENGDNLGVAGALNQGLLWARNNGYPWVIFFDQDSRITEGFIDRMFASWESHPGRERIGSIHPKYLDPETGTEPVVRRASDGGPVLSLTSGALMPLWIFEKIGDFATEYFIDCVDFEYCFRIRAAGYLIADSREAVLVHSAGHANKSVNFLGFHFRPTHHSAVRRYYMSRNRVALYRKYFRIFPRWILQFVSDSLRETIKCFVGEQDRARKFRNFLLGVWDGLSGKMGRRDLGSECN